MKKGLIFIIISIILLGSCIVLIESNNKIEKESEKITIVATLFPQYDFAKQIGGDKVNVSLLLTPGTETHTYEPTPQDIIKINKADLFIYTGKYMEPWSNKIAESVDSDTKILDASRNINLIKMEEDDEHEENEEHHHEHEYDPHIWLNPDNAIAMIRNIEEELCNIDKSNAEYYKENSTKYINEILQLDTQIKELVENAPSRKIAFGGTFAYAYFINKYNLEYVSAYESCGEDTEPSVTKIKEVIDFMKENDIKVIFYQELSAGRVASTIASETGAEKYILHTIHNATQEEISNGETYVSLMKKNYENLKKALNL